MSSQDAVALLGGTFDPVHFGHIGLAEDARHALGVLRVQFLPAGDPPHRPRPGASADDRVAMLKLAIGHLVGLGIDDREIHRDGPSYTALTLDELRREAPERPVIIILGADAFRGLPTWHRWRDILKLSHVAVAARPGVPFDTDLPPELDELWRTRRTSDRADLLASPAGRILVVPIVARDISASAIRAAIARGGDYAERARTLMPRSVWDYIAAHRLYAV